LPRKKANKHKAESTVSLSGLDFETALRAAMQTGKMPVRKSKKRKNATRKKG